MKVQYSKKLSFTKMHALGNDFIVLDGINQTIKLTSQQIQKLADRHLGIGCDQLLLIEPPQNPKADFYYRIFNADGSEVAQCGNGARCVTLFLREHKLTKKKKITLETHQRTIECYAMEGDTVRVNMGLPEQNPVKIPFIADIKKTIYTLRVDLLNREFEVCPLSMGNPHSVLWVKELKHLDVKHIGALLAKHPRFPERANVDFTEIRDRNTIELRVFERGVGETLACGSAACASMVASKLLNLVDRQVNVIMAGGTLTVEWDGDGSPVWLTGPAEFVFNGTVTESFLPIN
jgi:diaminopimelate epimerase